MADVGCELSIKDLKVKLDDIDGKIKGIHLELSELEKNKAVKKHMNLQDESKALYNSYSYYSKLYRGKSCQNN